MVSNSFSDKIKIKLIKLNMTQTDLANMLNISRQYLNNVLNGRQENLIIEEKLRHFYDTGTIPD